MPRARKLIIAILALALGAAAAWAIAWPSPGKERPAARQAPPPEVTVATVAVGPASISLRSVGTVQPIKSVQVMPLVEGPIIKVGFVDGQDVQAGDLLFQIDPRPYQAALTQAEGQRAGNEAELASARRDFARTEELARRGFAARQVLDQQRARVATLEAAVRTDQGRIEQARIDLERTAIRAPIAGRISAAALTEGNVVRPGQSSALTTINQVAPIDVEFTLPQDRLPEVQARQTEGSLRVKVSTADGSSALGVGELVFIDNRVDPSTGTVAMKARFRNEDHRLWPGQFVNVALELERREDAVLVDSRAVQTGPNGRYVYVVADGKAEARPVELVELAEAQGVVAKGLQGGEQVIINGQIKVLPGGPVRVRQAPQPAVAGNSRETAPASPAVGTGNTMPAAAR